MAYATLDDVQKNLPQFTLSATSKPTLLAAQDMLDEMDARWRAALVAAGYVLTTVDADPYAPTVIKDHVITCTIAKILTARAAAVGGDAAMQSARDARQECMDAFKALAEGTLLGIEPEGTGLSPMLAYSEFSPRASIADKF